MPISLNGDGVVSGVSTLTNPSEITVGTGASVFSPAANTLALGTNGSERVRVDSSGNVGIGTDNPQAVLHAYHPTSNTIINVESGDAGAVLNLIDPSQRSSIEQNGTTLKISSDSGAEFASSDIRLQVDGGTVMRAESTGNVKIDNGNLVFSTSGTGIDFSATADATGSTSELLDDYEEGTFTVTMQYYNNGWVDATFSNTPYTTGYYVKVGKMCTAYYYSTDFQLNVGNGTGALFRGLPFSAANLSQGYVAGTITHVNCFQQTCQNLYLAPNTAFVIPIQSNSTSTSTWNNTSNVYIMWSITYRTN